jgi:hypothetical protein
MLQTYHCRRPLALLLAAWLTAPAWAQQEAQDPAGSGDSLPRTGRVEGKVLDSATGAGVEGAVVVSYHLDTGNVFSSERTSAKGRFRIDGLPLGWHDLYIEIPEGLFLGNQVINVPPRGKIDVVMTLTRFDDKPTSWWVGKRRDVPGQDESAIGEARLNRTAKGRSFWRTPLGIGLVAGAGAVVVLIIATSGDSSSPPSNGEEEEEEPQASPFMPEP